MDIRSKIASLAGDKGRPGRERLRHRGFAAQAHLRFVRRAAVSAELNVFSYGISSPISLQVQIAVAIGSVAQAKNVPLGQQRQA